MSLSEGVYSPRPSRWLHRSPCSFSGFDLFFVSGKSRNMLDKGVDRQQEVLTEAQTLGEASRYSKTRRGELVWGRVLAWR